MTVSRLESEMDVSEYREWEQFYQMMPFGPDRADVGPAIVACTVANSLSSRKRYKVNDFLPKFAAQRKSPEERRASLMHASKVFAALANQSTGGGAGGSE